MSSVFQCAIQKYKDKDIKNYNFANFLYGCETSSLTLREEHKLMVLEKKVPKEGA
jgi:hypothetical protein